MEKRRKEIEEIYKVLCLCIPNLGQENENFHIGEFVEKPNQYGCFKRNLQWFVYNIDEKNFCTFTGPFTLNATIYACAKMLGAAKKVKGYRFSEEELKIYLNNNFHTFAELDEASKCISL